ncbi:hypothetical protein PSI9734_02171 [Pseudidiomarina piscicola]|uniref:DUF1285 domain-containing protein n=1 Tax=Pseudidiomarina piscicola TaxID=2614830 RepID=A0A6S6WP65_9GAMM|nr:DUF1285 domain-containing protein [Pseudidiomarina piscicola]CAB0151812.1 hypothetical protein PSI9734_02171 [Pseudidiomarina piscicola]VZT41258.1 hypothetical protein PSI9734_02171 [Pseudomonas aeruginosa]
MQLQQLLKSLELRNHAPTDQWNPPYCGEIPIHIDANGEWFYQNSRIKRKQLVKLFSSVLVVENDDYFLVTPAEKVKISVADAPFIITEWAAVTTVEPAVIQVTTNIGNQYPLSNDYPLVINDGVPYVQLEQGLRAKVHRNVYYQWVEQIAIETEAGDVVLNSGNSQFILGTI